jgi:hypothetical protein
MAALAMALIVTIGVIGILLVGSSDKETNVLTVFSSGSDNIVLGTKGRFSTGYIELPRDAKVLSASFNVTGMLPPKLEKYDVGVEPISIVAADLDADSDPDVVVLNTGDNSITILKNLGEHGFVTSSLDIPSNSWQVITAHLNDDDFLDIASISSNQNISVFLTQEDDEGNWNFNYPTRTDYKVGDFSHSLCALDYDSDGDQDLVASCKNSDTLTFLMNEGDGDFTPTFEVDVEHKPGEVMSSDFNNDGYPDLAVYNRGDSDYKLDNKSYRYTVSILMNTEGSFDDHTDYGVAPNPSGMSIGDVNLDGWDDIVVSNEGFGVDAVSVLINKGEGLFPTGDGIEIGADVYDTIDPNDALLSDLNGDSYPDVITACRTRDSISVLLNDGSGRLQDQEQYFVGYSPKALDCADFDGDGDLDVTTADMRALNTSGPLQGSVSILKNLGYGVFSTDAHHGVGNCPRGIETADFDNNGHLDIATANYFGSTLSVLPNYGNMNFGEKENYLLGLEPYSVDAADFDGDGYLDVASADEARFVVIILFNDRTGRFRNDRPDYNIGGYPFSLHTGDYDGDGDMDIITANHGQHTLALLYNRGNGTFEDYKEIDLGPNRMPFEVAVVDVNDDGYLDLVTANLGSDNDFTNTISVLFNKGNNDYTEPTDYIVGKGPSAVAVKDFDGDGDKDVASANLGDHSVTILTNDGSGVFTYKQTLQVGKKPYFLSAMDFDSDGDFDIIVTNSHSNSLSFLLNNGQGDFSHYYEKTTGSYPYQISIADMDLDGRDDIVITNVNTASVSVVTDYYYPKDVALDLDRQPETEEYKVSLGTLAGSHHTGNLANEIQSYLEKFQHLADEEGNIKVPITILTSEAGLVQLSDLEVEYEV